MIRLRIERVEEAPTGLCWYENGFAVGKAILEREEIAGTKIHPEYGEITAYKWVPVEVIDEG